MDFFTNIDTSQNQITSTPPITSTPTITNCSDCFSYFENNNNPFKTIYTIFHFIITLFAIYLSFKCNNGFSFGGFFMDIFFPYIYIIYKYATTGNFCDSKESNK